MPRSSLCADVHLTKTRLPSLPKEQHLTKTQSMPANCTAECNLTDAIPPTRRSTSHRSSSTGGWMRSVYTVFRLHTVAFVQMVLVSFTTAE